jgi:DNA (cytosine-5)-methyltransferase 1
MPKQLRFLSVCSGIEAASVAWEPLGWKAVGFAEIEPFPCEVLKQRFPNVPNYGDLTKHESWPLAAGDVDILVGGPPCQAFSVAGLREGMADPRGNLSLIYFRLVQRLKPKYIVYENVPGLLSSRSGSDFSSLLTALAECGYGFAYRVLDASHFGLAQRRKRIFLVGCRTGDWRHPTAILFDGPSSFGNPPKGEEKGKGVAPDAGTGSGGSSRINCQPDGISGTVTNKWHKGSGGPAGDEHYNQVVGSSEAIEVQPPIAFKVRCGGEYTGTKGGEVKPNERGGTGMLHSEDKTFTIASTQDQFVATQQPIPINTMAALRDQSAEQNRQTFGVGQPGDKMFTITKAHHHAVGVQQQFLYENHPNDSRVTGPHDVAPTVAARFGTGGGNVPLVQGADPVTFQPGNLRLDAGADPSTEATTTLKASMGDQMPHVATPMAVRRLTPNECLRLQGFPDNWTRISWRGKSPEQCPDGPQYKAIGNSMAVNCMAWIGRRIQMVDEMIG